MGSRPLRVAVLSRHQLTRAGLTQLLKTDPQRVRVVDLSPSSDADGHTTDHDVTVYDLADLSCTRDDDLAHLLATPVVGLVPPDRPDLAEGAPAIGIATTIPMDVTAQGLLEAVEISAARAEVAARHCARRCAAQAVAKLTDRELEVIEQIAAGLSNKEIAANLWVSINSVKTYIRSAYHKIGVTRRPEAILWAYHHGLAAHPPTTAAEPRAPETPTGPTQDSQALA